MSDSSDEEYLSKWIPYSQRNDWTDVTPLPQDDGECPIVAISYSPKFREVFDYFRAILARNEKSPRALELTTDALHLNPANYSVWYYRREILKELNYDLNQELDYIEHVITANPKNYQVWHHRRVIVEMMNDASNELKLTEKALKADAKNYHAWQHRQWAIKTYNLYDDELTFIDRLIAEDIRNNSAWNQRFFILKHYGFTPEVIQRELHYTMNRIRLVKNNESSWNFLRGILNESKCNIQEEYPEVLEFAQELFNSGSRSPYLLAFLINTYSEQCLNTIDNEEKQALFNNVCTLCADMGTKYDIIRRKYWQYITEQLKSKLEST